MLRRIKNLWAWSQIDPYQLQAETGKALIAAAPKEPAEIVYINKIQDRLEHHPDISLDDLIS